MSRTRWSTVVAFGTGAVVAAAVLVTPGAEATDGQPIIGGRDNSGTSVTRVANGNADPPTDNEGFGLEASGMTGGLRGDAEGRFVGGVGVLGDVGGGYGYGVEGVVGGSGAAVFGNAIGPGPAAGVSGLSDTGVGVQAQSNTGPALKVIGRASFSSSGVVTVPAGASSQTVRMDGVTPASMVLATAQQSTTSAVKAAVPARGTFTIQLTRRAPAGGLRVAYFVLD